MKPLSTLFSEQCRQNPNTPGEHQTSKQMANGCSSPTHNGVEGVVTALESTLQWFRATLLGAPGKEAPPKPCRPAALSRIWCHGSRFCPMQQGSGMLPQHERFGSASLPDVLHQRSGHSKPPGKNSKQENNWNI